MHMKTLCNPLTFCTVFLTIPFLLVQGLHHSAKAQNAVCRATVSQPFLNLLKQIPRTRARWKEAGDRGFLQVAFPCLPLIASCSKLSLTRTHELPQETKEEAPPPP